MPHYSALLALLFICSSTVLASNNPHTMCYNHFLQQDGCVHNAADSNIRCESRKETTVHSVVTHPSNLKNLEVSAGATVNSRKLQRRYDDTSKSFFVKAGKGICGLYQDNQDGACLWSGVDQPKATIDTAGWLNDFNPANCGKKLFIQRSAPGSKPIYVPIVDGCSFDTQSTTVGCFRIAFTNKTFWDLEPTLDEKNAGYIQHITWDFVKPENGDTRNAPV